MNSETQPTNKNKDIHRIKNKRTMSTKLILASERAEIAKLSTKYAPSLLSNEIRDISQPKNQTDAIVNEIKTEKIAAHTPKFNEEYKHNSLLDDNFNLLCLGNEQASEESYQVTLGIHQPKSELFFFEKEGRQNHL